MKLEEIIERIVNKGTELWEPMVPDAVFTGVLIEDNDVAKSLKKMRKEKLDLLHKYINSDLVVIDKPDHTFYNSNTVANLYTLSKEINGNIKFKKERLKGEFGYKVYEIYKRMIDSGSYCLHKNNCPVTYLKNPSG
jgi:hypothetical protein